MEFGQADDTGFTDMDTERYYNKAYKVDFTVLPLGGIEAAQSKASNHIANILGVSDNQARTLLRAFKWNKERLIEQYMDSPQEILDRASVVLDEARAPVLELRQGFVCGICFDDDSTVPSLELQCGHGFCQSCYEHYVTQKIVEEGECRGIVCPGVGCKIALDEQTVNKVVQASVMAK